MEGEEILKIVNSKRCKGFINFEQWHDLDKLRESFGGVCQTLDEIRFCLLDDKIEQHDKLNIIKEVLDFEFWSHCEFYKNRSVLASFNDYYTLYKKTWIKDDSSSLSE